MSQMIHYPNIRETRIRQLNDLDIRLDSDYVLYWMQQSQRAEYNHALEYAVLQANHLGIGVVVAFGLTDDYPEANLRHYTFMLEGLTETQALLEKRGIHMVVRRGKVHRPGRSGTRRSDVRQTGEDTAGCQGGDK